MVCDMKKVLGMVKRLGTLEGNGDGITMVVVMVEERRGR